MTTARRDGAARAAADAAAWQQFDTARSSLAVWLLALPPDGVNRDNADDLQVSMRGICEVLSKVRDDFDDTNRTPDVLGMAPLFALSFAAMIEGALWNFLNSSNATAPTGPDLAAAGRQVLAFLAELEPLRKSTFGSAAAAVAAAAGGAA